ncbi:MAG TPA: glucodextranase DOMON-like domain-containing protein [Anaeromyxobacteraceae bacterium]|nr:glucodextranase DOMON-like domain-containing protein [Anaeromyxobacteraceae bacterium]
MWKEMVRIGGVAGAALVLAASASAQEVSFKDPTGDDFGPGNYVYPTDPVYKKGSFDLTGLTVKQVGDQVTFTVTVNSDLEDPWAMPAPASFSVQMAIIHVQTGKGGLVKGIPGTNVAFAPEAAWNKVVILSPQPAGRVRAEVKQKAVDLLSAVVVPNETRGAGRSISGTVSKKDLGEGDVTKWGFQVLMQSNEGFPDKADVLTRKVNEYEGQHRFGGGNDGECDPHVMDVLAGKGVGDPSEIEAQKRMLSYECGPDGASKKMATLGMVRK